MSRLGGVGAGPRLRKEMDCLDKVPPKEGQVSKEIGSLQETLVDLDGKVGLLTNKLADVMDYQGGNPIDPGSIEEDSDIVNIASQIRQLRYHAVNIINQLTDITQRLEL